MHPLPHKRLTNVLLYHSRSENPRFCVDFDTMHEVHQSRSTPPQTTIIGSITNHA